MFCVIRYFRTRFAVKSSVSLSTHLSNRQIEYSQFLPTTSKKMNRVTGQFHLKCFSVLVNVLTSLKYFNKKDAPLIYTNEYEEDEGSVYMRFKTEDSIAQWFCVVCCELLLPFDPDILIKALR